MVKFLPPAAAGIDPYLDPLNILVCVIPAVLKSCCLCIQFKVIVFPVFPVFLTVYKLVIKLQPILVAVRIDKQLIIKPTLP